MVDNLCGSNRILRVGIERGWGMKFILVGYCIGLFVTYISLAYKFTKMAERMQKLDSELRSAVTAVDNLLEINQESQQRIFNLENVMKKEFPPGYIGRF